MRSTLLLSLSLVTLTAAPLAAPAFAEVPTVGTSATLPDAAARPAFGRRGQLVLHSGTGFSFGRSRSTPSGGSHTSTSGQLTVALDLFATDRLTVGLVGGFERSTFSARWTSPDASGADVVSRNRTRGWSATTGVGVGWHRPIASWVSFWPRAEAAFSYGRSDGTRTPSSEGRETNRQLRAALSAPVLLHPVRHFFFGAGPLLMASASLGDSQEGILVSGSPHVTVGGWW